MTRLGRVRIACGATSRCPTTSSIAETLLALEQRLAHVRENLKTPELRERVSPCEWFRTKRD